MKGIYLGAFKAYHSGYDIDYQDINGKRDIAGDMLDIDLSQYDFIIATPPCQYYSRCWYSNGYHSDYALKTRHLLPEILKKLVHIDKPFIVENVRNVPMMKPTGVFDLPLFVYFVGRHTYWSNIMLPLEGIVQNPIKSIKQEYKNQGGQYVHDIIEIFLETVHGGAQ